MAIPSLVKSYWNKIFPSMFANCDELVDRLLVHAHGIVNRKSITRRALLDVTRAVHARNVRDAGERRAVNSLRRSTVKWDGTSTA